MCIFSVCGVFSAVEETVDNVAPPPVTQPLVATRERCTVTLATCLWAGPSWESHNGGIRLQRETNVL